MNDQRSSARFQTIAKVVIKGLNDEETILKDISVTGCRVECPVDTEIEIGVQHKLEIIPESISKIDSFELLVESIWIRTGSYFFEIGFSIVKSPRGKQFQRYVDYLSWRYSQGSSMIGDKDSGISPPG